MAKKLLSVSLLVVLLCPLGFSQAQNSSSQAQNKPEPKPEEVQKLVEEYFGRLNDLDNWFISMDGKEENNAVVDRFLELFAADAYLQVGPSKNQLGTVTYHGLEGIRKWVDQFSRSFLDLNYRTHFKTRNEQTAKPVYVYQMPWGDRAVAVEFTGVYTVRNDRKRYWIPGAAFFTFDKEGKIQDARLYMLRDEMEETKTYVAM